MKLSVCLITRNEEDNLERALRSVKSIASEIIITDTGSTDNTIEIAQEYNARINHFEWCDDFAAARNSCFSQASADWIFWLDADEELLPDSVDLLNDSLVQKEVFAYFILRQDFIDTSRPDLYTEMFLPRLFRRHKDIHLIGRIHAQFSPTLLELASQRGQEVKHSNIRIRHDGFTEPMRKSKLQRDVKLLQLELRDHPGRLYYQIELYRTLLLMDDDRWRTVLNEASVNLRQYIDTEQPPIPLAALLIETLLQFPESELPSEWTVAQLHQLTQRWFPRAAPLLWLLAKQDYEQGRFDQAEVRLRQLLQMGKDHSYDRFVGFNPRIFGDDARLNLAVCLTKQTKLDEASQILKSLRTSKTHRDAAQENLKVIRKLKRNSSSLTRRKRKR